MRAGDFEEIRFDWRRGGAAAAGLFAALILVAMSVQGGLLAALITLAGKPMYQNYGVGASALSDQALGGVMMWVIAGLVYLGAFSLLFARALTRTPRGRRDRPTNELHAPSAI